MENATAIPPRDEEKDKQTIADYNAFMESAEQKKERSYKIDEEHYIWTEEDWVL